MMMLAVGCMASPDDPFGPDEFAMDDPEDAVGEVDAPDEPHEPLGETALVLDGHRVASTPGFDLDVDLDDDGVQIDWSPQPGAVEYTVWHSAEPYWEPGDEGTIALHTGVETSFEHLVAGDGSEHYYRVVAHIAAADMLSTTVGKYPHVIHNGYNKISQPLDTGLHDAEEFASDHGPYLLSTYLYDAEGQSFVGWAPGGPAPFGYEVGEVPIVHSAGEAGIYENVGYVPALDAVELLLPVGHNVVTVPLSVGDISASEVLDAMPEVTQVGYWDSAQQAAVWHDGLNQDFAITAGQSVYLETTMEIWWPGPITLVPPPPPPPLPPLPPPPANTNPLDGIGPVQLAVGGFEFTEGVVWLPSENALVFSDLQADQIWRYDPGVGATMLRDATGRFTNGQALDPNGNRIECQHATQQVVRIENDGSETVLVDSWGGLTLNSPNDAVIGPDGSIYFTDATIGGFYNFGNVQNMPLGFQGLYRIDPQGAVTLLDDIFGDPTGIDISPSGDTIYIGDWLTHQLHAYPVLPDGSTGPGQVINTEIPMADGICVDVNGNIYATSHQGIWVLHPDGTPWGLLLVPEEPANCVFGGPGLTQLYIAGRMAIYVADVTVPGAVPFGS